MYETPALLYLTYTSWSELLYMNAFWNINSISLWNSMSVLMVCRMVVMTYGHIQPHVHDQSRTCICTRESKQGGKQVRQSPKADSEKNTELPRTGFIHVHVHVVMLTGQATHSLHSQCSLDRPHTHSILNVALDG